MKEKKVQSLNMKDITKRLQKENKFIFDLCRTLPGFYLSEPRPKNAAEIIKPGLTFGAVQRATSLEDLQRKLKEWKGKRLGVKDRRLKKGVKNKIDKNKKKNDRRVKKNLIKVSKQAKNEVKPPLPETDVKRSISKTDEPTVSDSNPTSGHQLDKEGRMVFSKFDFIEGIADEPKKKKNKVMNDPRKLLKVLEKQNEVIEKLKESGDIEKANSIKTQQVWKSALNRAQGIKVKDDPKLLNQAIKEKARKKVRSQRKWAERGKHVEEKMRRKQEKREANINERLKRNKTRKIKKMVKRGRLIPGYSKFE